MACLLLSCCLCLTFVFGQSVLGKTRNGAFHDFAASAGPLEVLPVGLRLPAASAIVAAETVLILVLLVGAGAAFTPSLRLIAAAGFVLALTLLLSFTAAMVVTLRRGVRRPCRCFGASATPLSRAHVVRNVLLLSAAIAGLLAAATGTAPPEPAGVAVAVIAGLVGGLLVTHFDDLIDLFGSPAN